MSDALDLFTYQPRVTRATSIAAMRSVSGRSPNLRTRCWRVLDEHGPMTADEVAAELGESVLSVRPQFTLLTKENKIADTGKTRRNDSDRQAIVWRANPPELWCEPADRLTSQERIRLLTERIAYLELLLAREGVVHD